MKHVSAFDRQGKRELLKQFRLDRVEIGKLAHEKDKLENRKMYMKDKAVDCDHVELKRDLFEDSFREMLERVGQQRRLSQDICRV